MFNPEPKATFHSWLSGTHGFGWFGQGMSRSGPAIHGSRVSDRRRCLERATVPGHREFHHIEVGVLDDVSLYISVPGRFIVEHVWSSAAHLAHARAERNPQKLGLWAHTKVVTERPATIVAVKHG